MIDIEKNASIRQTIGYSNISEFKEYKLRRSKNLIDEIDNLIYPLYGLSRQEIDFVINYEKDFRTDD